MTVLVAPDKFKGSLTAREVAERIAAGIAAETTTAPRAVFTRYDPSGISAIARASTLCRVSSVSGQWTLSTNACRSRSSSFSTRRTPIALSYPSGLYGS